VDSDEPIEEGILMRPIRIGVLGVLAFVPASWALDEPPGAPSAKAGSLRARLEVITKEFAQAHREYRAVYVKATTDDERRKAIESRPTVEKYAARVMELAESAPDDPAAVDALVWVVRFGGQTKEADRAIERLVRDHAQDPKVAQIGRIPADSMSPAAERLLRAIAEKSPDRAVQKRAAFALARLLNNEADFVRRVKQGKGLAASVTQYYGPERTEALRAQDPDALARQGKSLFKAAVEKFGDAPREPFEAIRNEYEQAQQEFRAAYQKATTEDERRKAAESRPTAEKYVARMMGLAESAPDDPGAVDALVWLVTFGGQTKEVDQAIERLARDHAQDIKTGQVIGRLAGHMSPAAEHLLRAIAEKSPDRAVQGGAFLALARLLKDEAALVRRMKQNKEVAARVKQLNGPERTEALLAKDPNALARQTESLFEAVVEKFGDVSDPRGDPAKAAEAELYEIRNLGIGKTAPEITGEDLNGRPMKLSDYRGKVVVLVFCGDWCGPCRAMYPHERSLVKRLEGKPFALVGINSDRDPQKLNERIKKENITWPSWRDGGSTQGPIATAWNVHGWPTIYVLDHKGVIRYTGVRDKAMDKAVNTLLREVGIDVEIDATSEPK
jgi:thiol-disulfide isomerase/thioredoxin/ribonuclease D